MEKIQSQGEKQSRFGENDTQTVLLVINDSFKTNSVSMKQATIMIKHSFIYLPTFINRSLLVNFYIFLFFLSNSLSFQSIQQMALFNYSIFLMVLRWLSTHCACFTQIGSFKSH